ncbi:MAG: shikimate dehydrogenase [Hyphomicrobiales bacterium]
MLENDTKKACVVGFPIKHSKSPSLHNYWVKQYNLKAHYVAESISPDNLSSFLKDVRVGAVPFLGGNATIPHKEQLLAQADQADETATALGAANTFWIDKGLLHVTNTDVYGFLANLDDGAAGWDKAKSIAANKAIVLGAGGAARAIIFGLIQRGFKTIILANRTVSRAQALADHFLDAARSNACIIIPMSPADAEPHQTDTDILINTTSLGMVGQAELDFPVDQLPDSSVVTDIVYTPLETGLLKAASARGLKTVDGLGMLLHQAVPGFEKWFGVRPKVTDELRQYILSNDNTADR